MKEKLIDFVNDWQNVLTDDELEKIVIILVKSLEENDKMQLSIKHQQLQEFILDKLIIKRSTIYNLSDYKINCDKLDKKQIVKKIINFYEKS